MTNKARQKDSKNRITVSLWGKKKGHFTRIVRELTG